MIRGFDFFGGSLPPIKMPELRTKFRPFLKNWRRPTLAESIKPLPSARLRLTAEFGMGSGRTTALWPPKIVRALKVKRQSVTAQVQHYVKERMPGKRLFSENCTQVKQGLQFAS